MNDEIRKFLIEIEKPFIDFLYLYHTYPHCCHLASSLIATYLSSKTKDDFKHLFYCAPEAPISHSWVQCGNYIYDLVWYQSILQNRADKEFEDKPAPSRLTLKKSYRKYLANIERPSDSIFELNNKKKLENNPKADYYLIESPIEIPNLVECRTDSSELSVDEFIKFAKKQSKIIKNQVTEMLDPKTGYVSLKCLL